MRLFILFLFLFGLKSTIAQNRDFEDQESFLQQVIASSQEYALFRRSLEREAFAWLLTNQPQHKNFQLTLLSMSQLDTMDIHEVRYCSFGITPDQGEPFAMVWLMNQPFTASGDQVTVREIRKEQWRKYLLEYVRATIDTSFSHPDSIAVYLPTSLSNSTKAEKMWNKVLKQYPQYSKSGFEGIRKNVENMNYEYLYRIFSVDQITSISKKGVGFTSSAYEKETLITQKEIADKQWITRDAGDCRVVQNRFGMNLVFKDTSQLFEIPFFDFKTINAFLLHNSQN
jgi:hypothetical protein